MASAQERDVLEHPSLRYVLNCWYGHWIKVFIAEFALLRFIPGEDMLVLTYNLVVFFILGEEYVLVDLHVILFLVLAIKSS